MERVGTLINKLKEELLIAGSKFYFVKGILENRIRVFKETKQSITNQIKLQSTFPFYEVDGTFDYLLRMPIHSFTNETIEELKKQIMINKEELKLITDKTSEEMWLDDLKELIVFLNKK